jgi:hypothetical protein
LKYWLKVALNTIVLTQSRLSEAIYKRRTDNGQKKNKKTTNGNK